mgnify:CR=1 FL=1
MSRLPTQETQRLAPRNHRATVRYRCAPATTGKLYLAGDLEYQRAWIVNLSQRGLGATMTRPLPIGACITIQMRGPHGVVELPAQVVQVTCQNPSEWLIGCELVRPLSNDELETLL